MLQHLLRNRKGQGMAEYALILALVAVVAILAVAFLGDQVFAVFREIGNELSLQ